MLTEVDRNPARALSFIRKHGVVLATANGPVPRLTGAIIDAPIRGSWWAHPKSRQIFRALQAVMDSEDAPFLAGCRLLILRDLRLLADLLWPALGLSFAICLVARKQSIPISLGRLSRIEQTLWPNIASSPLCIFHAPLIGSNSRMLEGMESPKLRSFEEVPYVEMDHRHAPKQPETVRPRRCGITSVSNVFFVRHHISFRSEP